MSEKHMTVCIVNGSPKPIADPSVSEYLSALAQARLEADSVLITCVNARQSLLAGGEQGALEAVCSADALLLIFPLYFFCLPGSLMRFLQDYAAYSTDKAGKSRIQRVYALVNCGFPEDGINGEALRVVESFSRAVGARWRFGLMLGGGGMLLGAKDAPFMKNVRAEIDAFFSLVSEDVRAQSEQARETFHASIQFPRRLYFLMGNFGWAMQARRYRLKKRDLYKRPYRP